MPVISVGGYIIHAVPAVLPHASKCPGKRGTPRPNPSSLSMSSLQREMLNGIVTTGHKSLFILCYIMLSFRSAYEFTNLGGNGMQRPDPHSPFGWGLLKPTCV